MGSPGAIHSLSNRHYPHSLGHRFLWMRCNAPSLNFSIYKRRILQFVYTCNILSCIGWGKNKYILSYLSLLLGKKHSTHIVLYLPDFYPESWLRPLPYLFNGPSNLIFLHSRQDHSRLGIPWIFWVFLSVLISCSPSSFLGMDFLNLNLNFLYTQVKKLLIGA